MTEKRCPMCPYRVVISGSGYFMEMASQTLFDNHIDDHCSDFAIELELMNRSA